MNWKKTTGLKERCNACQISLTVKKWLQGFVYFFLSLIEIPISGWAMHPVMSDLSPINCHGQSPLPLAGERNALDLVQILLDQNVNIHQKTRKGETSLTLASQLGHVAIVELLIQGNARLDHQDLLGNSPLLWAVVNQHVKVVEILIRAGAHLNVRNQKNKTALQIAQSQENAEITALLQDAGAQIHGQSQENYQLFISSISLDNLGNLEKLIHNGFDINQKSDRCETALGFATRQNVEHLAIIKMLLNAQADVNQADLDGMTPLLWSVIYQHVTVVVLLIQTGAIIDQANLEGHTALIESTIRGNEMITQTLMFSGANIYQADLDGTTPLLWAIRCNQFSLAKKMIHFILSLLILKSAQVGNWLTVQECIHIHGIDLNSIDLNGNTPLLLAIQGKHLNVAHLLIRAGADVNHANTLGQTPLQLASLIQWQSESDSRNLVQALLDAHANLKTSQCFLNPSVYNSL